MKVFATDADDEKTNNAIISYRIDERSNGAGMFYIDSTSGEIKVKGGNLDRETQDVYKLVIIASDLKGQAGGNVGTGEVTIKVTDINDNVPYLEKDSYEASVEENTVGMEVLRVKAFDMDLVNTDNWAAVYEIASGNEAGSVGCCSILENDYDLAFLDDLGPKFKTLAEICNGETFASNSVTVEVSNPPVKAKPPVMPSTSTHTHVHTHTETVRERDRVNTLNASKVASESSTIVQEQRVTDRSQGFATLPKVQVQENVVIPNQTLLIQQPTMYYAATPMYVVEPNPQMVLVSGAQQAVGQVSQAGLNTGIMQIGGLQGSQGVVLVEGQVGMAGAAGQVGMGGATGQIAMSGTTTRQVAVGGVKGQNVQGVSQGVVSESSQVLLVENGSSGGNQSTHLVQGFGQTGLGSLEAGFDMRGKGVQFKSFSTSSRGSAGSKEDFPLVTTPKAQGRERVVVQHKKVTVTEANTRA
uniref:Cadherin domain-containing protein n=1 Tax=Iconisemion striatum TaxID=60296 RepID=A0A1A7YXL9_9TELE